MFESLRPLSATPGGESLLASIKASPPVAVTAGMAFGLTPEQWLVYLMIVYTVAQIAYLVWKWSRELFGRRGKPGA